MQAVTTIGLDIAKSVFQIHGVDAAGNVIVRRQLKRRYVFAILAEVTAVPRWHRSMCVVPSLVARIAGSWSYGAPDAAGLREALRQATQERCRRR
jgi:transposase